MFEQKKVSHEDKKSVSSTSKPIKLNVPDITGLGVDETAMEEEVKQEEIQEEIIEEKRPFVSLFKNLFGGGAAKQESSGGCGCFSR